MHGPSLRSAEPAALEAGIRALSRRELSFVELQTRIERAGVSPEEAARASVSLRDAGYQSDERAASERARVLADRGLGDAAIAADLRGRGLTSEVIEPALADLPSERERAERVAGRVGAGMTLVRVLRRKGFSEGTIDAVAGPGIADAW